MGVHVHLPVHRLHHALQAALLTGVEARCRIQRGRRGQHRARIHTLRIAVEWILGIDQRVRDWREWGVRGDERCCNDFG